MRHSTLLTVVSAFCGLASALPRQHFHLKHRDVVETVYVTAGPAFDTAVQEVTVTVFAGSDGTTTEAVANVVNQVETVVINTTFYVDQFGNPYQVEATSTVTPPAPTTTSAAPAKPTTTSVAPVEPTTTSVAPVEPTTTQPLPTTAEPSTTSIVVPTTFSSVVAPSPSVFSSFFVQTLTIVEGQSSSAVDTGDAVETPQPTEAPSSTSSEQVVTVVPSTQFDTAQDSPSSTSSASDPVDTGSSDPGLSAFAQDVVDAHNADRAINHAGPVSWNQTLADFASSYLAGTGCVFQHSGGPYGENIAMGFSTSDAAIQAWYDEWKVYDFAAGQFGEDTGHFTQLVWLGTDQIGCASIDCGGSGPFFACEYYPRGNIIGAFVQNVLPA